MRLPGDAITLRVRGLMLEKLMNRAIDTGALIYRARKIARREIEMTLDAPGAKTLMELAAKYSMDCSVSGKRGCSAIMDRLKGRPTMPVAFIICAVLTWLFLSRVWVVDISLANGGNVPEDAMRIIAQAGVEPGVRSDKIDAGNLALALSASEGIAHASVKVDGAAVLIELRMEDAAPELYDIGYARDLVAGCDAVIESVTVKSGVALVKSGDTVRKGDVLISGSERVSKEETHSVGALGSVTGRIWKQGEAEGRLTETVREYTGNTENQYGVWALSKYYSISGETPAGQWERAEERLYIGELFLPIYIEKAEYRQYTLVTRDADIDELKTELSVLAMENAETLVRQIALENTKVIDKWTDFSIIDTGLLRARGVIELCAEIAVTREYLEGN